MAIGSQFLGRDEKSERPVHEGQAGQIGMKWLGILLLLFAAPATSATVFGIGTSSCATALHPASQFQSHAWILGFWSGMNGGRSADVGEDSDAMGIIGEVEKYCQENPSDALAIAAAIVFYRMEERRR